jgi:hypothetical protein
MTISAGKGEQERERANSKNHTKKQDQVFVHLLFILTEPAWVLVQQHMKLLPFPSKKMVSSNLK